MPSLGSHRTSFAEYAFYRLPELRPGVCRRWIAVNEARLLASLHHPNVVEYKQCFVEDSCLHVVMELVACGELTDVIE